LSKEGVLVVGLGEVGLPLYELLAEIEAFEVYGFDIDQKKMMKLHQNSIPRGIHVMHICIPCFDQNQFVDIVSDYAKQFKPKLIIIDSTVPPKTTIQVHSRCHSPTAHSPVRGVHENLERMKADLKHWTKYIGGVDDQAAEATRRHFEKLGLRTKVLKSSSETELAKLFETTYRAWMISCFQEMHRISAHFGADFDEAVDFLEDTHRVRFDRPVMFPGPIGGHCLIPNIELLMKSYDSEFLRLVIKSNERRKKEMKDKVVREEVQKVKERVETLQEELIEKFGKKR
jgi:UDP-N-acetyl-D-mannosaminuronate dehydrogenase